MQNINATITEDQIRKAIEDACGRLFKDSYNNPIDKALQESISSKTGDIKKVIDEIIVSAISDPSFKTRIADAVISRMVEASIKK